MAYTPDWEPLADAFKRVVATGVPEDEAKRGISRAIADGKIRVQVTIAERTSDIAGTLTGANVKPPPHLMPDDFDWQSSCPLKSWPTGPREWKSDERPSFPWRNRPIASLEVRTADVTALIETGSTKLTRDEVSPLAEIKKPKRGRPPEYNWDGVKSRLTAYASQHGPVQTFEELMQKIADFASDLHPKRKTPSDKTMRDAIAAHELNIAAGFAPGKSPGN